MPKIKILKRNSFLFVFFSSRAPQPDGALNNAARIKIRHYRQLYADRPDPMVFLPVAVSTSGRVYDDFVRLIFLHVHREASRLDFSQSFRNESYYSHRFVYTSFYTITSFLQLSSGTSSS